MAFFYNFFASVIKKALERVFKLGHVCVGGFLAEDRLCISPNLIKSSAFGLCHALFIVYSDIAAFQLGFTLPVDTSLFRTRILTSPLTRTEILYIYRHIFPCPDTYKFHEPPSV